MIEPGTVDNAGVELALPVIGPARVLSLHTRRASVITAPHPRPQKHAAQMVAVTAETASYSANNEGDGSLTNKPHGPKLPFLAGTCLQNGRLCAPEVHVAHVPRTFLVMDLERSDPLGAPYQS